MPIFKHTNFQQMTLEQLKAQEIELRNALSENLEAQKKIMDDEIFEKTGVCVGAEIEFKDGREIKKGSVTRIRHLFTTYVVHVNIIKKDGSVGMNTAQVYPEYIISVKPKQ